MNKTLLACLASLLFCQSTVFAAEVDAPIVCEPCEEWNVPEAPFRIYGNTYYVGVSGLSSVLVVTSEGLVVLDGGLPQSVPLIEENIRTLGFEVKNIRWILNSHAHYDHAGGLAALQRDTGAEVIASAAGAEAIRKGDLLEDDPQFGLTPSAFPRVEKVRVVRDQEKLKLGDTEITAHLTPGHTPGSTTWTWKSCEDRGCLEIVYADSLNSISGPDFRYSGNGKQPDVSDRFRQSIRTVEELPCDILLTVHPGFSKIFEKHKQRGNDPRVSSFRDINACRAYAAAARSNLETRLAEEKSGQKP